ncbi:hypothetical protein VSU19_00030 [Verrucomicrobiales bacterium BCK34]|nr:hypothetical protein [Verrucomicrobiales bacterium BCK34]
MRICPHCEQKGLSVWDCMSSSRFSPAQCRECDGYSTSLHISAAIISGILSTVAVISVVLAFIFYGAWAAVLSLWLYSVILAPLHLIGRAQPVGTAPFGPAKPWKSAIFHSCFLILIFMLWRTSDV